VRKIKYPKIGQYVLVTRWSDKNPMDPWYVSVITKIHKIIGINGIKMYYEVEGSKRLWKNSFSITKKEGEDWLKNYDS